MSYHEQGSFLDKLAPKVTINSIRIPTTIDGRPKVTKASVAAAAAAAQVPPSAVVRPGIPKIAIYGGIGLAVVAGIYLWKKKGRKSS